MAMAAGTMLVSGCAEQFMVEPARIATTDLSLSISYGAEFPTAPGWSAAYDSTDHVWVRMSRAGTIFHEETAAFSPAGADTAFSLEIELEADQEDIAIAFELRRGADPLFRGDTTVVAKAGEEGNASVTLDPIVARVAVRESADSADAQLALGDTTTVEGAALFATGDTITTALTWSVLDTTVLALLSDGRVHAIGPGQGRLAAIYQDRGDTTVVSVIATAGISLSGSYPEGSPSGWAAAYDSTDQLWVQLSRAGSPFHEQTTAFAPATDTVVSIAVELLTTEEEIGIAYELRRGADALFGGDTTAVARVGTTTETPVTLRAVAAVVATQKPDALAAIGDTLLLLGGALFATGDTITSALAWEVLDTAVLALTAGGDAVAVGPGAGRVVGSAGGVADTVEFAVALAAQQTVVSVASGQACVVTASRTIECWGRNFAGALGTGVSGGYEATPVQVASAEEFISVSAGGGAGWAVDHTCGLSRTGQAFCWGHNGSGQLGTGGSSTSTPTAVAGDLRFGAISVGSSHTCGLALDGAAYCWGYNVSGQLGDGTQDTRVGPTPVSGGRTYTSIEAGYRHTCAVEAGGTAWCWGNNIAGQLGDGTTSDRSVPVAVAGGNTFQTLGAGIYHTCGITDADEALCWGDNGSGKLGDGTQTSHSTPVAVTSTLRFSSISSGGNHNCAVALDDQLYCWGYNGQAQLGDGTLTSRTTPALVAGGHSFDAVGAGDVTCGVLTDGKTYCWGMAGHGTLGTGALGFRTDPGPVSGGIVFSSISHGDVHACGVATDGATYCWGSNHHGPIGDGTSGDPTDMRTAPVQISGTTTFVQVEAGHHRSCALSAAGGAWCWGLTFGSAPIEIVAPEPFSTVSMQGVHACAIGDSGAAYCWGHNGQGQLGDGTTTSSYTEPVLVAGGLSFSAIKASSSHTCGIADSGAAYCWGSNFSGKLGDGTETDRLTPVQVAGGLTFSAIAAARGHSCALDTNGSPHCWGYNAYGNLGDGTRDTRLTPVSVATNETFASISGSNNTTCARATSGAAYCWGYNFTGELGKGSSTGMGDRALTPELVAGDRAWSMIDTGCGVTTTGAGYCWGERGGGILGDGTTAYQLTPALVPGTTGATPGLDF